MGVFARLELELKLKNLIYCKILVLSIYNNPILSLNLNSDVCKQSDQISAFTSTGSLAGTPRSTTPIVFQMATKLTPAAFIPHGGGPMPLLGDARHVELTKWLKSFAGTYFPSEPPKGILVISAHWEASVPTILSSPQPDLYYDYYGFPAEAYKLNYPAKNNLELVERIHKLLDGANIEHKMDPSRGYDHGVFVPLLLMFPKADIPVLQLSLIKTLDPKAHYSLGAALTELRRDGIFILGSGMSYHNMAGWDNGNVHSIPFHAYLNQALVHNEGETRVEKILNWTKAPSARQCHQREEHLIPLIVVLGAAGTQAKVTEAFHADVINVKCSGYIFE